MRPVLETGQPSAAANSPNPNGGQRDTIMSELDRSASETNSDATRLEAAIKVEQRLATVLGAAVSLIIRSPSHRNMFMSELEWRVLPPLALGQSRLFIRKGMPFAFVTWALVNDEVASRLKTGPAKLQPSEWNCGPNFVVIDLVAPFGGAERCLEALQETTPASRETGGASKQQPH